MTEASVRGRVLRAERTHMITCVLKRYCHVAVKTYSSGHSAVVSGQFEILPFVILFQRPLYGRKGDEKCTV